jgi:hypothetical protein
MRGWLEGRLGQDVTADLPAGDAPLFNTPTEVAR